MSSFLLVSLRDGDFGRAVATREFGDFHKVLAPTGAELTHLIVTDETVVLPDLTGFAGVIVGGSALNVTNKEYGTYQQHAHDLLTQIISHSTPAFLVCFGAGWLTHHLGGVVDRSHGETPGGTQVHLTAAAATDPLLADLPAEFEAFSGHTESIAQLPAALVPLATGPTCPVQMVRYGDQVWAAQFHSELDAQALAVRMEFYKHHGYFAPEEFNAIVATLDRFDVSVGQQVLRNFVTWCAQREGVTAPLAAEPA